MTSCHDYFANKYRKDFAWVSVVTDSCYPHKIFQIFTFSGFKETILSADIYICISVSVVTDNCYPHKIFPIFTFSGFKETILTADISIFTNQVIDYHYVFIQSSITLTTLFNNNKL